MSDTVLLYNADGFELLKRIDIKKAINMLWREVAEVLELGEGDFAGIARPKSLRLLRYVVTKWRYKETGKIPFSRVGVLRRDNYTCCYCGVSGKDAEGRFIANTVDHVLPKWKGNAGSWTNLVAACQPCNNEKGGRSPLEAGMPMRYLPHTPTFEQAYKYTHGQ